MAAHDSRKLQQSDDTAICTQTLTIGSPELEIFLGVRRNCWRPESEVEFRFKSFAEFRTDVGNRPSPEHALELIDEERGYRPGNCRWIQSQIAAVLVLLSV